MKTFKQFLTEAKQINEALNLDDSQNLAYCILSNHLFSEKPVNF